MNKKIYYLIYSPSFGDTLAATPTLRYLSQSHESKINVGVLGVSALLPSSSSSRATALVFIRTFWV